MAKQLLMFGEEMFSKKKFGEGDQDQKLLKMRKFSEFTLSLSFILKVKINHFKIKSSAVLFSL